MEFLQPTSLDEALALKADHPGTVPIAGGTDMMVELNFDRRRPDSILDLTRVRELTEWWPDDGHIRLGAGVTYTRLVAELPEYLPGLAIASRTIGSPQIRNRATVGGNLGTASPAGAALPPLLASAAQIEVASTSGTRRLEFTDFMLGPKKNALEGNELISAVLIPKARGPQQFSKIGTRNAMVISVASVALAIDGHGRKVATAIGSAGPVILGAPGADQFIASVLHERRSWETHEPIEDNVVTHFGELVARAASPIDDVRGTRAYRRHALSVMARRTLTWAWDEYMSSP
ncbi:MAG: FAD binding domain-containing protein [Actinobacteria bacterium]|nr:FAD binding domain-containing protein [Actinomycetota bacterium]